MPFVILGVSSRAERPRRGGPISELQEVYEENMAYVWHSLRRLGVGAADLEDLTHDVFLKAFHTFDGYDHARPLRPWLFGIALRTAVDHRRQARHRMEVPGGPTEAADQQPGAERGIEDVENRRILLEALDDLSWDRRALVVMFYLNGQTIDELAEVFPAPKFTLYSRLRLARGDLRRAVVRRGGTQS
jgi:RNA polymerase sigma-70 factor (ECF subfamily)